MGWGEEVVNRWSTEHIWGSESTAYYDSRCKITADGDYSHEKMLAPWKESYDKLRQNINKKVKSRHITLLTKVIKPFLNSVQFSLVAIIFPVVMYGHESWTIKKAEC